MSRTIRWLHLSDFHVGKDDYAGRKLFEYIHAHVEERVGAGFAPDLVFVSGDLAEKGRAEEHSEFWCDFALPLLECAGLDDSRLFTVPGNHDVEREENPAIDRVQMAQPASRYFDPTSDGQKLRALLLPRFESYLAADLTEGACSLRDVQGTYTTVVEIDRARVGIAGINTAWLSMDDEDKETLTPGKPLVERALDELGEVDLKIVLGHHPISWLVEAQQRPIKALFANHSVLYLHGHLHYAWTEPTYGGADQFLAIQSGAAFQSREGEKWRNGLVWGQVELDKQLVRLQAMDWNYRNQDWSLVGSAYPEELREVDWWVYPTPGSEKARRDAERQARRRTQAPAGWEFLETGDLAKWTAPLEVGDAIGFFDGALPTWKIALSSSVPERAIVGTLMDEVKRAAKGAGQPTVTLLLAPAGEGKSTVLLQVAGGIVAGGGWRVAHRLDDSAALPRDLLDAPLPDNDRWLLVVDEADGVAEDLRALLTGLPGALRPRVHALIACRDSDWLSGEAPHLNWSRVCRFSQKEIEGLEAGDAAAIVEAWTAFGDAGLGELERVDKEARVAKLIDSARDEMAKGAREAFFGALLATRHGSDLQNHVRLLLERLGARKVSGDRTLRDALALVAAMHAEGFSFLSRPVLAEALDVPVDQVHQRVVYRLGREAAAASTSTYVMTRHRRIAKAAVRLLEQELGVDIGGVFVDLVAAAIDSRHRGNYIPNLGGWRYDLPNHFMRTDRPELAIETARAVVEHEPEENESRVNLAHLYRQAGDAAGGAKLLRESVARAADFRSYYSEWGSCEEGAGDAASGVSLLAYSISDQISQTVRDVKHLPLGLNSLAVAFKRLYGATGNTIFRDARIAAAVIGKQLPKAREPAFEHHLHEGQNEGGTVCTIDEAFDLLGEGVALASNEGINEVVSASIPEDESFTFEVLKRMMWRAGPAPAPMG